MENSQLQTELDTLFLGNKYITFSTNNELIVNCLKIYQSTYDEIIIKESSFLQKSSQIRQEVYNETQSNLSANFEQRNDTYSAYPYLFIGIAIIFILIAKLSHQGSVKQLMQSVLSFNKFKLWMRDTDSLLTRIRIYSIPAYLIVFSLFIDFSIQFFTYSNFAFDSSKYFLIFGYLTLYYLVRIILISISGFVFNTKATSNEYINNIQVINGGMLIFLIPILLINLSRQLNFFFILLIISVSIFELLRIFRGILLAKSLRSYHLYYFFLYFCTIEILPLVSVVYINKLF